jgi:tetratricopeptide (TPR) repeat protein
MGYLEQQSGNVSEAIGLYQQALAIDANSAQAHYNLGLAFAEAKVFKEAVVEWETVVRLDPDGELGRSAAENVKIIRQYLTATP